MNRNRMPLFLIVAGLILTVIGSTQAQAGFGPLTGPDFPENVRQAQGQSQSAVALYEDKGGPALAPSQVHTSMYWGGGDDFVGYIRSVLSFVWGGFAGDGPFGL
jgi:hypothetical protein